MDVGQNLPFLMNICNVRFQPSLAKAVNTHSATAHQRTKNEIKIEI